MCASVMTFASFVSAMVVRRGLNNDWGHIGLPHILWWNTGVLILSSIAIDMGRRLLHRGKRVAFNWLWSAGTMLGTAFLAGQVIAWIQLQQRGFYLRGHPSSAFFYVLTWAHAAHVIGALGAVMYVEYRALRYELGPSRRTMVDVSAIFWHFLDVLWLGIMALFVFWA
jgi:cytochrome c oxidase subunit 3